jgi:hypothetical protein
MTEPKLVNHIEQYIGKTSTGYRSNGNNPISILRIEQTCIDDCSAVVSLGLSLHTQYEIVILSKKEQLDYAKDMVAILAESFLQNEFKIEYKSLIGPLGLIPGTSDKTAFLLIPPIYFDEKFNQLNEPFVSFVWAVPVTNKEVDYINQYGIDSFLEQLEINDPDLSDLNRLEVI